MDTEVNNLRISEPLSHKLNMVARAECTTVEDLVQDLLAEALDKREVDRLFSSMQAHARSQGLTEADVEPAIAEYRKSKRTR
jgi:fructose-1,6-bisphosphatase/sedoheptulose 1,7-bisphosphatase-like protein